jgi:hypothetical protein
MSHGDQSQRFCHTHRTRWSQKVGELIGASLEFGIADLASFGAHGRVVGQTGRDNTKDFVHATIARVFTLSACPRRWDARAD